MFIIIIIIIESRYFKFETFTQTGRTQSCLHSFTLFQSRHLLHKSFKIVHISNVDRTNFAASSTQMFVVILFN